MAHYRPLGHVFADYGVEGEPWHERIVLCRTRGNRYMVVTPDSDIYEEDF